MVLNAFQVLVDMDSLGVDMHVVSTFVGYNQFGDIAHATAACRETNDEVAQMTRDYPDRFAGLATLPMQDVRTAIGELERSMQLGLKGTMINDTISGRTFDEPELLPFWQEAERMGALILVHQGGQTLVSQRSGRGTGSRPMVGLSLTRHLAGTRHSGWRIWILWG